jgi:hypothetical protein
MTRRSCLRLSILLVFLFFGIHPSYAYDSMTREEKEILLSIRQNVFGGSKINEALTQATVSGAAPPIFAYENADRTILSWKVKEDMVSAFAQAIGLPPWMTLAKVSPIILNKRLYGSANAQSNKYNRP